jgi:hypothetical protein
MKWPLLWIRAHASVNPADKKKETKKKYSRRIRRWGEELRM